MKSFVPAAVLAGSVACIALSSAARADEAQLTRGAYLASIMDCMGCHTPRTPEGEPVPGMHLAGSQLGFDMGPLGIYWPPNLTPDPTGLGDWTPEQMVTAIRTGQRPDGRSLAPIMPWGAYSALTDEDAAALVAYLRSLPPVAHEVPAPVGPGETARAPYFTVRAPG